MGPRTVGVEEELLLVDPGDGRALAVASAVLHDAAVPGQQPVGEALTAELTRQQIETNTRPCTSLDELGSELRRWRRAAAQAAQANGAQVAALATSPLPVAPSITPDPRYREMIDKFGLTAEQQLACGCHIHVEVGSDEEGVAVLDHIRGWLPTLLALSGNSPFWQGEDTGYASFRSQVWNRWPSVLTLNVPDRPVEALRELRHAALAEFGTVQTRVDRVENGQLHLAEVEVDTQPAAGTDSALLAAGHPTLTALESVHEASGPALSQWLESARRVFHSKTVSVAASDGGSANAGADY